jgi:hypothetical protein
VFGKKCYTCEESSDSLSSMDCSMIELLSFEIVRTCDEFGHGRLDADLTARGTPRGGRRGGEGRRLCTHKIQRMSRRQLQETWMYRLSTILHIYTVFYDVPPLSTITCA